MSKYNFLNEMIYLINQSKRYITGKTNNLHYIKEIYKEVMSEYQTFLERNYVLYDVLKNLSFDIGKIIVRGMVMNGRVKTKHSLFEEKYLERAIFEPPCDNNINDVIGMRIITKERDEVEFLTCEIISYLENQNYYAYKTMPNMKGMLSLLDTRTKKEINIKVSLPFSSTYILLENKDLVKKYKETYIIPKIEKISQIEEKEMMIEDYYSDKKRKIDDILADNTYGVNYEGIHLEVVTPMYGIPIQIQIYDRKTLDKINRYLPYTVYKNLRKNHIEKVKNRFYTKEELKRYLSLVSVLSQK